MPDIPAVGTRRLELVPCSLAVANALSDNVEEARPPTQRTTAEGVA